MPSDTSSQDFYQWDPNAQIRTGDRIVYLEITENLQESFIISRSKAKKNNSHTKQPRQLGGYRQKWQQWQQQILDWWRSNYKNQIYRVAMICGLTVVILLIVGTGLFLIYYPGADLYNSFLMSAILLLEGYYDLYGNFSDPTVPWWLRTLGLILTLAGTAFVGVIYALLTEALLSLRLQFLQPRSPIPLQDHVILIGLGSVGQKVAELLQEFQQPLVAISLETELEPHILPQMPLITRKLLPSLEKANLATAKSIIAITRDEMVNLEVGLMAQRANPQSRLVLRTFAPRLSQNLARLLPQSHILSAYSLTAKAFAGAAFGENILSLFRLHNQTILVTEYNIEAMDTPCGLLLSEIAYGYGVVPILANAVERSESRNLMPSEDLRLAGGDRLVVLATIEGLRKIEAGGLGITPKQWRIQVDQARILIQLLKEQT